MSGRPTGDPSPVPPPVASPPSPAPAAAGPPPRHPSRLVALFSTANDPRRVISDPDVLARYQRRRLVVAVVGGILGGVGVGFSFSHSGLIGTGIETALLLPMVIGIGLAVGFVLLPVAPVVRWLAAVGAIVVTMLVMEVSLGWQVGLALVGAAVSWAVAAVLQFGIGVVQISLRDFVKAVTVGAGLLLVVAQPTGPAGAQSVPTQRSCPADALILDVAGDRRAFGPGGGSPVTIEVAGEAETRIEVSALTTVDVGTVVVELVGLDPIDLPGIEPAVVWVGDLRPAPGGGRADGEVVIGRPAGRSTLHVETGAYANDIGLVAGQARYRATLHDPATTTTCWVDGVIRITASPADTVPGRIGLAGAAAGLGMAAASVLGGGVQAATRLRLREQTREVIGGITHYRLVLQLRVDEDREAVHSVEATGVPSWIDMVDVEFGGAGSVGDHLDIPIQIRTDPKKVRWDLASFDLEVNSGGVGHSVVSLRLSRWRNRWVVESIGSAPTAIDLRDPTGPPTPPPPGPPFAAPTSTSPGPASWPAPAVDELVESAIDLDETAPRADGGPDAPTPDGGAAR